MQGRLTAQKSRRKVRADGGSLRTAMAEHHKELTSSERLSIACLEANSTAESSSFGSSPMVICRSETSRLFDVIPRESRLNDTKRPRSNDELLTMMPRRLLDCCVILVLCVSLKENARRGRRRDFATMSRSGHLELYYRQTSKPFQQQSNHRNQRSK